MGQLPHPPGVTSAFSLGHLGMVYPFFVAAYVMFYFTVPPAATASWLFIMPSTFP